jgi:hypothetical protein
VWVGYHTTAFIQDVEHTLVAIGVAVLVGGALFILMRFLRKRIDAQELALDPLRSESNAGESQIARLESDHTAVRSTAPAVTATTESVQGRSEVIRFTTLREQERVQ